MSILKAFIGLSSLLISINAFSFDQKTAEKGLLIGRNYSLLAEDIFLLDVKQYLKSNIDKLSLNIFLNNIYQWRKPNNFISLSDRLNVYIKFKNHKALANIYEALAFSKADSNLTETSSWLIKALEMQQELEDNQKTGLLFKNLSWLSYIKSDFESAELFSQKAISSLSSTSRLFGLLTWHNQTLLAQGKAREVEYKILKQGLLIASRNNNKLQEWECYYQLGKSYLLQNKMVQARWFCVQALTLSESFRNKTPKIKSLLMLAKVKTKSKDYSLALQNLKIAESLIQKSNQLFLIDINKQFADVFHSLGNRAREQQYLSSYTILKNKALNNSRLRDKIM